MFVKFLDSFQNLVEQRIMETEFIEEYEIKLAGLAQFTLGLYINKKKNKQCKKCQSINQV